MGPPQGCAVLLLTMRSLSAAVLWHQPRDPQSQKGHCSGNGLPALLCFGEQAGQCDVLSLRLGTGCCWAGTGDLQGWGQDSQTAGVGDPSLWLVASGTAHLPVHSTCSHRLSLLVLSQAMQSGICLPGPAALQAHGAGTPALLAGPAVGCPCPPPATSHTRAPSAPLPGGQGCRGVPSPPTKRRGGCRPRAGRQEPFGSRKLLGRKTSLRISGEAGRAGRAEQGVATATQPGAPAKPPRPSHTAPQTTSTCETAWGPPRPGTLPRAVHG